LSRNGRCKVVDFGLARLDEAGRAGEWANPAAESVGTPQFIAPDILSGAPASASSDIYSLGGTLFYLLTGHPPFEAKTTRDLLKMHVSAPVPDLRSFRPDASRGLADAVAKALAKRPAERWASMEQFARVLRVHAIPIAAGAAPEGLGGAAGGAVSPVADYGSGSGLGSGYAPPPTPTYFPTGPVAEPLAPLNRPARPASPVAVAAVEVAPPQTEPQLPLEEELPKPETSEPTTSEAIEDRVPHGGLPAWPLLAGGGVLIAAIVAVLCIVFLKAPPKDVASNATPNNPPAATIAPAPEPTPTPPTAAEPAPPPAAAEVLPPSLVAQWVADDYEVGSPWTDRRNRHIAAVPKNAPAVAPKAFNKHAGVRLNGDNQYFVVSEHDYPLSDSRMMTIVAVFKPQADTRNGHNYWEGGGIVGADIPETKNDWGLAWGGDSGSQVVGGVGNFPLPKNGGRPDDYSIPSPDLEVNRAHVAVMTWDFAGNGNNGRGTLTLYVDGVQVGEKSDDAEPRRPQLPIALGATDEKGKQPFLGLLAEVRLYNDTDLDVPALCGSLLKQYADDRRPANPFDSNGLLGK
ncbi:MAG TPA: LamG-like jellyroll fold domain-containing protein, partial [Tepidisphaeraceae bacterium]